jgi:hypothetical protein
VLHSALASVHELEFVFAGLDELSDAWVRGKGASDISHLTTFVASLWIWKEQNTWHCDLFRCHIVQLTDGASPNGVELGLDHRARPFPDLPSIANGPAVLGRVALDYGEAVVGIGVRYWFHWEESRLLGLDQFTTEIYDRWRDFCGRRAHLRQGCRSVELLSMLTGIVRR